MKPIMSHDLWMRRTRRGPTKPRSAELRAVDYALLNYTNAPSSATLDLLAAAVEMWASSKDDPERSIRNSDGAVTELIGAIRSQRQVRSTPVMSPANKSAAASTAATPMKMPMPDQASTTSPNAAQIKEALGIFKHPARSNVTWEGFSRDKIDALCNAYEKALEAAAMAAEGLRVVAAGRLGVATNMYVKWFGAVDPAAMPQMVHSASLIVVAMKTRPITFVLRHHTLRLDYEDPSAAPTRGTVGLGYAYAGAGDPSKGILPHHTGSGMRVYLGPTVQERVLDDHYSTHTIYHELTHKVINTSDMGEAPSGKIVDVYGAKKCTNLATRRPEHARQLADCWSFYAMSFLRDWN
jgi:hypothetical protein